MICLEYMKKADCILEITCSSQNLSGCLQMICCKKENPRRNDRMTFAWIYFSMFFRKMQVVFLEIFI